MEEAKIVKSGEMCIQTTLYRTSEGIKISVKAHPRVEEFMRMLSASNTANVRTYGRLWIPPPNTELIAYTGGPKLSGNFTMEDGTLYTIDPLAQTMSVANPSGAPAPMLNLSFLRLVGISEGDGVSFQIRGVYSLDMLRKLRDQVVMGTRKFYNDFVRPISLTVSINSTGPAGTSEVKF